MTHSSLIQLRVTKLMLLIISDESRIDPNQQGTDNEPEKTTSRTEKLQTILQSNIKQTKRCLKMHMTD